jgi:hypothetical protein
MTLNDLLVDVSPVLKVAAYYMAAGMGMIAHWLKSHMTQQTQTKLMNWFFENYRQTAYTVTSVVGTSIPAIAPLDLTTTSMITFITMGFSLGFTSDSAFNSETPSDNTEKKE